MDSCCPIQNSAHVNGTAFVPLLEQTLQLFLFFPQNRRKRHSCRGDFVLGKHTKYQGGQVGLLGKLGEPQKYCWLPAVAAEFACR